MTQNNRSVTEKRMLIAQVLVPVLVVVIYFLVSYEVWLSSAFGYLFGFTLWTWVYFEEIRRKRK